MYRKNVVPLIFVVLAFLPMTSFAQQVRQDVGTKLLIPSSARTAVFTSFLAIINQDTQSNSIHIQARNADGSTMGETSINLPVGGRFRSSDILGTLGVGEGAFGPISIESTNGRLLSAVSEVTSSQGPAGFFPGVNVQSAWQQGYILEVNDTGNQGTPGTVRTNIGLNTIDGSAANVSIQMLNNTGTQVGVTINTTVAGNGLTQLNSVIRTLLQSGGGVTGVNGYLKIVSDRPIVAWASKVENGTNDPSFQIAVGAASTVVSPTQVDVIDFKNNFLFLLFAFVGTAVLLWQQRKGSRTDFSQGTIIQETV
jgi:hypothetical protein